MRFRWVSLRFDLPYTTPHSGSYSKPKHKLIPFSDPNLRRA